MQRGLDMTDLTVKLSLLDWEFILNYLPESDEVTHSVRIQLIRQLREELPCLLRKRDGVGDLARNQIKQCLREEDR